MRNIDLNLLVIFDAIMREGSMTRAANRLSMTQPAVSNAVARMRIAWNDPVFVRQGRGINPSPFARSMWDRARPHLDDLREMANPAHFDAASAQRIFRIGTSDATLGLLWLQLRQYAEHSAPGINFHAVPLTNPDSMAQLVDAEIDVAIDRPLQQPGSLVRSEALFDSHFVCAMRPDHPLAAEDISLQTFAGADHLLVSLTGDATGFVDELLQPHGLQRRVAMTINHFSLVPKLLTSSNLISVVPYGTVAEAACRGELWVTRPPIDIPPITISLLWHKRSDKDAGQRWLRERIRSAAQQAQRALPPPDCVRARQYGVALPCAGA